MSGSYETTSQKVAKAGDPVDGYREPPSGKAPDASFRERLQSPLCKREPEEPSCFLGDVERSEMIDQVRGNIVKASSNYALALEVLGLHSLYKGEEDIGWLTELALDTLGGHLIGTLAKGLTKLRSSARRSASGLTQQALGALHPERLKSGVKIAIDHGKSIVKGEAKETKNKEQSDTKAATSSYINFLSVQADKSFHELRNRTINTMNDIELYWLWESLDDAEEYSTVAFKAALESKIARYHKAGVSKIGQSWAEGATISRNTRVITLFYSSGHPSEHWLEAWEMAAQLMDGADMNPREFTPSAPKTKKPQLLSRVPDEFVEAAKVRQQQVWGKDVSSYRIIDESEFEPWIYGPERYQRALEKRMQRGGGPHPSAKPQVPTSSLGQPNAPKPKQNFSLTPKPVDFGGDRPPLIPKPLISDETP